MKVPLTVVVFPAVTVTCWGAGSLKPSTWLKETVYCPAGTLSQFKPQESAMTPSMRDLGGHRR